jgi:hypothetical protein
MKRLEAVKSALADLLRGIVFLFPRSASGLTLTVYLLCAFSC